MPSERANASAGPATATRPLRVVVMPFTASPADANADPLRFGLAETLHQRLGSSGAVDVVGRQSVQSVLALGLAPGQAALLLNAGYVLDGSLQLFDEGFELEAQFRALDTGAVLWRESYAGDLGLLQRLPDRLERRIRAELGDPSSAARSSDSHSHAAVSTEAHLAYLKGRFAADRRTPDGLSHSLDWYQRALAAAPEYAAALTGIAQSQHLLVWYAGALPREAFPRAMAAAQRALALDPHSAEAATVLGLLLWTFHRDLAGAEQAMRQALQLNPASAEAHHGLAQLLALTGRLEEAERSFSRALELEPLSLVMRTDFGTALLWNDDAEGALEIYAYVLELDSDFALARMFSGIALHHLQRDDQAAAELERALQLAGRPPLWLTSLARVYARAGRHAEAQALLDELALARAQRFVSPVGLALVALGMDRHDEALALLEQGLEQDDPLLIYLLSYPELVALRGDARFEAVLARSGLLASAADFL